MFIAVIKIRRTVRQAPSGKQDWYDPLDFAHFVDVSARDGSPDPHGFRACSGMVFSSVTRLPEAGAMTGCS